MIRSLQVSEQRRPIYFSTRKIKSSITTKGRNEPYKCMIRFSEKVSINISGCIFETFQDTLRRFPKTLLGDPILRTKYYDIKSDTFFFDRSREAFDAILFYYQSNGCLIRPPWIPMDVFEYECIFFELGEHAIKTMKDREGFDTKKKIIVQHSSERVKERMYDFFEKPESSYFSRIYTFLSLFLLFISVGLDCYETTQNKRINSQMKGKHNTINTNKPNALLSGNVIAQLNLGLNLFFAVEFILRLSVYPSVKKFAKGKLNIIDFFSIFPMFLVYFISREDIKDFLFVRVLRTLRVIRLVRLSKSFETLSVVLHILAKSIYDLLTLIFCMMISCTVFGSVIYYSEQLGQDSSVEKTDLCSIPEAMYFAMQTVVSVGYGDIVPKTTLGKVTSAITAIIGALTMTVPLLSLGGKYFATYTKTFNITLSSDLISTPSGNRETDKEKNNAIEYM